MKSHSGSILRKLEGGFALAAMVLAGLMALFMDRALHRSLALEDAQVLEGQARSLLRQLATGHLLPDAAGGARPEKAAWRVLDASGNVISQSRDLGDLPALPPGPPQSGVQEIETEDGKVYAVLLKPWSYGAYRGTLELVMDRTHEAGLIRDFRRTLLLGVIGAIIAAVLLARSVAKWGLEPLEALIQEAESINDRNLDRRLEAENFPLELQELVATLNASLSRLQEAFQRVGNLGAELAHELRTPLQNLRSTLENRALRPGASPIEPSELGVLIEDCDRMGALIEQILFLARAEHASSGIVKTRIPAGELLEEVRDFFEAAAEEAGVELRVEADPGIRVWGDRLLLVRALHNLTANALRHTPSGGSVILSAKALEVGLSLAVEDTGSGIPEQWISRLGTPFLRPPEARISEGHGLGLAIVKRVAAMLDGEMSVESRVGEGTRVALRLPTR